MVAKQYLTEHTFKVDSFDMTVIHRELNISLITRMKVGSSKLNTGPCYILTDTKECLV